MSHVPGVKIPHARLHTLNESCSVHKSENVLSHRHGACLVRMES